MHWSSPGSQSKIITLTLVLVLATLWLLMHGYHGLTGDGQIYAFQALSRIHPQLATDLYLQNTSQDQFTIFSPFYSGFIGILGLENAARLLTIFFTAWFVAAAWSFARAVSSRDAAWFAAALLLIVAGDYGGSGVFHFPERFLTARLPAEALATTALACHFHGRKSLGLLLAIAALFVHPLIALPALLLLIGLRLPGRLCVIGAIAGVITVLAVAFAAAVPPPAGTRLLTVMDATWLEVVMERSQFLFLQLWSVRDWEVNTRPFLFLGFTAIAVPDERVRRLCMAAALVGAAGLAVGLIGSVIGPLAILVQGQAWRWVWITALVSTVLLPVTVLEVWRDPKCSRLCAILLVSGCTVSAVDGTVCVSLALIAWSMRTHVDDRAARYCRGLAVAIGIAIVGWILFKFWQIARPPISPTTREPSGASILRDFFGLRITAAAVTAVLWWWIRNSRKIWVPAFLSAALAAVSVLVLPAAFEQSRTFGSTPDLAEFADWIYAIPPASTVLVAPTQDAGAFVWFTLGRPNYLAVDQSAGVVFSRATAIEVRRRSQVLLPLTDPNWKILSSLRIAAAAGKYKINTAARPLTAKSLMQVCADPQLGFVISPENVGSDPLRHEHAGAWKDWNLYDCRDARSPVPAT
jgi:hypothetical protein